MTKKQLAALLAIYDENKSLIQKIVGDHADIKKLRALLLSNSNENDLIPANLIKECFSNNDSPYENTVLDAIRFITSFDSREMEPGDLISLMQSKENRKLVLGHTDPRIAARALVNLNKKKIILDPENRAAVLQHTDPVTVADAFVRLNTERILNSENRAAVLQHTDPQAVANILIRLNKKNIIFNPENRAAVLQHADPVAVADAFVRLNAAQILDPENRAAVLQHADPVAVADAFVRLNAAQILDPENRAAVLQHADLRRFSSTLNILNNAHILTRENFNSMLQNPWLFTPEIMTIYWYGLPNHLLNQAVFDEVLRRGRAAETAVDKENAIRDYILRLLPRTNNALVINGPQSTHTPSVHATVSESVIKLRTRYGKQISGERLHAVIQKLTEFIMQLPVEPEQIAFSNNTSKIEQEDIIVKRETAKNCLPSILQIDFMDGVSETTLQEMLALSFIAISDYETILNYAAEKISDPEEKQQRLSDEAWRSVILENSVTRFVEGFYEIACIYNLNANGTRVVAGEDKRSCTGGTFNKPIECLAGVHPDVSVIFMTEATAAAKLQKVVMERAVKHVFSKQDPMALITKIKEEGIDCIWETLKPVVSEQMFEEFSLLYKGKDDPTFMTLIDSGQYTNVHIEVFLQEIAAPIVRRALEKYGAQLSNPKTEQEFLACTCCADELKKNNMQYARDQISARIAGPLFDEVKSFYPRGKTDPDFIQLVKKVSEISRSDLPDLDQIRQNILSSEGYRKYCSLLLSQRRSVFAPVDPKPNEVESDAAQTNFAQKGIKSSECYLIINKQRVILVR